MTDTEITPEAPADTNSVPAHPDAEVEKWRRIAGQLHESTAREGAPEPSNGQAGGLQQLQERAAALEERAQKLETENLRLRIAGELGLPAEAYEFMTGDDEASVRAGAERLQRLTGRPPLQAGTVTQPAPAQEQTIDSQIESALRAGNPTQSIALKRRHLFGTHT